MGLLKRINKKESNSSKKITEEKESKEKAKRLKIIRKEISKQRKKIKKSTLRLTLKTKTKSSDKSEWIKTGITGLDELLEKGIPRGVSVLVAGGAGSGKTIACLQIANHAAINNEKVLYISLEESELRLKKHMHDFGWNPEKLEKKNILRISRVDPFKIAKSVEALLAKEKGELKMNIEGISELIPKSFRPDWIIIDSLTALAAAFKDEETTYRIYIEQLFRYLEKLNVTSFLISETEQIPVRFSKSGVEEFLADGVIVLYNIQHGDLRENAIEILKLRGAKHQKKIVAMQINKKGIVVYPEQEVFKGIEKE